MEPSRAKVGSSIYDLDTSATLVDLDRLEQNIGNRQIKRQTVNCDNEQPFTGGRITHDAY